MQTYFLDNRSINGGKQWYIQIFQNIPVQSLLAFLVSVLFYNRNKSNATELIALQILNCRKTKIIFSFSALSIQYIENFFK
jgi:hypothetical protein